MAENFKAKNLTYTSTTPRFLQKLRQQSNLQNPHADPDRHVQADARRSVRADLKLGGGVAEGEEEGPVVLDEEGREVSGVVDGEGMLRLTDGAEREEGDGKVPGSDGGEDGEVPKEGEEARHGGNGDRDVRVGGGKKRKIGKVVGGGKDSIERTALKSPGSHVNGSLKTARAGHAPTMTEAQQTKPKPTSGGRESKSGTAPSMKKKQKVKAGALSFDVD